MGLRVASSLSPLDVLKQRTGDMLLVETSQLVLPLSRLQLPPHGKAVQTL